MSEALAYLEGLLMDTGSLYFASKAGWKYPMNRLELQIADLFDLHVAINSDPKKPHNLFYERPFEVLAAGTERISGTPIPLKEADNIYKVPVQTKTDEEILEINRQKLLSKQKKEELNVG